mmetsp:Transcript_58960/g.108949  ORF Transcript_58960/g.108949 Transcript_58960/m.108949 type:complete len:275 (-) Transcript_58960:71-895(-)
MAWPWRSRVQRSEGELEEVDDDNEYGPRSDQRSIWLVLQQSRHNFVAFGVLLSSCSFAYMFVITLVLMATGGVRKEHPVMVGCLLSAHLFAQASTLVRMVCKTMYGDEEGLDVWWCSTAVGAFVVDITQGTFLIMTWRAHWIHRAFIISLIFIFLLDMSEVFSAHGMRARRRARIEAAQKHKAAAPKVETFTFKKAEVENALGKAAIENPCHVCLDELQDGELVGKLACGHIFHAQCIKRWLKTGSGCPLRCAAATIHAAQEPTAALEAETSSV